ncbi:DUF1660 family phage protein [Agitococcus lubricus]|uniref:Prophage protein DUF1660 n=1 Tax=Agitococcus lubricus TaxID=1077255 RepID=A0A2T5J1C2_9GAMM|nr:DUF1660 family phage protein [Agitococcus lubricus]PTQ90163.1 prophage protein DUF1660 [Agitococcus lubricus]
MMSRRQEKINKLLCKVFGHQLIDGVKYHNHATRGSSKICQRCGFYEVVLADDEQHLSTSSPDTHAQAVK